MDPLGPSVPSDPQSVSVHAGGSVCNVPEQEAASVRQSLSRRRGLGSGRNVHGLEQPGGVRISAQGSDSRDPPETGEFVVLDDSGGTSVAEPAMVSNSAGPSSGVPAGSAVSQEDVESAGLQHVPHTARHSKPTRLGLIKRSLLQKGFSEEVARRASQPLRKSSLSVYQSHFKAFADWLDSEDKDLESVDIPVDADYLVYMFHLGREPNTIANHRSALSEALGLFEGYTVGTHPVLSALMKNFSLEKPRTVVRAPEWKLTLVLSRLMEAPFEPPRFDTVEQKKFTTWKTMFLLALASTKRASEIHAISRDKRDLIFTKEGVHLRCVPRFLAKTVAATASVRSFFIPRHDSFTGRDTADRLLCPVRMLKYYVHFSGSFKDNSRLFFKCRGQGEVCIKTTSSWLRNTIMFAHSQNVKARGHEVRKASASWAFASGLGIEEILRAGSWTQQTTFTSHYLHDVVPQMDGTYRLCPVVAGAPVKI